MAADPGTLPGSAVAAPRRRSTRREDRERAGWGLATPFFVLYFLFLMWPVLAAAWKSLFSDSLAGGSADFRGLGNYGELLGDADFWASMWHTLLFTLLSTPPLVVIPLALALLVNRVAKGQWLFRLAFFAPYVLPVSVVVLIWNWLYQPGFGLVNGYLTKLGFAEVNCSARRVRRWSPSSSRRCGGRSASTSCSSWPACRRSRRSCTRRPRSTARTRGSRSAASPCRCSCRPPCSSWSCR